MNTLKTLLENYQNEYGYIPTYHELFDTSPELILQIIEDKNRTPENI